MATAIGFSRGDVEGAAALAAEVARSPFPRGRCDQPSRRSRLRRADGLRFPVVMKANIGGSGAGIVSFDRRRIWRARRRRAARSWRRPDRTRPGVHTGARRTHHESRGARAGDICTRSTSTAAARASTCAPPTSARPATASSSSARCCAAGCTEEQPARRGVHAAS